jgi:uncharacterized protein (UPF0335 family)
VLVFKKDMEMSDSVIGHNGGPPLESNTAADRLRSYIERWENLQQEKKDLAADQKDIMQEAKSAGYDLKAIRAIIKLRAQDPADAEELDMIVDTYRVSLGMV